MSPEPETTTIEPSSGTPGDPQSTLAHVRTELEAGRPLAGSLASAFYRAVHALDPTATEDVLAALPGNGGAHIYDSLVSWAPVGPGETVADVGCGSGGATRSAAKAVGPAGRVIGIDPSPEALAVARVRTPRDLPVTYVQGVGERLSMLADRSADCAVASMVLEQATSLGGLLAEVSRVLRPGGRLVASVMAFDRLRPLDAGLMGSVMAVVARRAPGALRGRASRASIPHEPADGAAFTQANLLVPEERDLQLAVMMETVDEAWALFSRTYTYHMLDEDGRDDLRRALERRMPHTLYLPVRFLRTRRPG